MNVINPYYQDDGITIYCGDCRDILPTLELVDSVLTDPPYGIGWKRSENKKRNSKAATGIQNDQNTSVRDEALLELLGLPCIVFGSFYAPFPQNLRQVLIWIKGGDAGVVGSTTGFRRDAEPIFLIGQWPVVPVKRSSAIHTSTGQGRCCAATGHPHTKPLPLIRLLLEILPGVVIDPFMGSGTTLVAAKQLARKAIGIEIEEKYCEIAVKRLAQGVLSFES
jgi:DNA modification methylase